MVDEMMLNPKYRELLLTSPYFNKILQTIRYADTGEKELVEIISILCSRIAELENDLMKNINLNHLTTIKIDRELKEGDFIDLDGTIRNIKDLKY